MGFLRGQDLLWQVLCQLAPTHARCADGGADQSTFSLSKSRWVVEYWFASWECSLHLCFFWCGRGGWSVQMCKCEAQKRRRHLLLIVWAVCWLRCQALLVVELHWELAVCKRLVPITSMDITSTCTYTYIYIYDIIFTCLFVDLSIYLSSSLFFGSCSSPLLQSSFFGGVVTWSGVLILSGWDFHDHRCQWRLPLQAFDEGAPRRIRFRWWKIPSKMINRFFLPPKHGWIMMGNEMMFGNLLESSPAVISV